MKFRHKEKYPTSQQILFIPLLIALVAKRDNSSIINFKMTKIKVIEQLMNVEALTTVVEIELVYKSKVRPSERPLVNSLSKYYQLLLQTEE